MVLPLPISDRPREWEVDDLRRWLLPLVRAAAADRGTNAGLFQILTRAVVAPTPEADEAAKSLRWPPTRSNRRGPTYATGSSPGPTLLVARKERSMSVKRERRLSVFCPTSAANPHWTRRRGPAHGMPVGRTAVVPLLR